jgi:DNA-binding NtrC family response regulator
MKSHKLQTLKILHLEDNSRDAESIGDLLRNNVDCAITWVKNKNEFENALSETPFDVVLCNFTQPSYSGLEALEFARKTSPATPFLFVSEPVGEPTAVECIKKGAEDFLLKDAPERLVPAIARILDDVSQRNAESRNGIAHEFNNILLPIVLAAEMLQTESSAKERSDWIEIIASNARRGQQIIQRLAKVSKSAEA